MNLCNACQRFDIRELLLKSEAQKTESTDDFRPPIPHFYKHLESMVALKTSSETGCTLCGLFWLTCIKTLNRPNLTDEWLNQIFEGQLYIGSSGWTTSDQGFPYITLMQQSSSGTNRTLGSFEAFTDRDDLPDDAKNLVGRSVYKDSSMLACTSLASEWLRECLDGHKQCGLIQDATPLPTRVIDVGDEHQHPKLIATGGRSGTYVALSYCWGGDSDFVFKDSRKEALLSGIPVDDIPQTLRDAVLITRRLGIKYVWIDALCIKQDSAEDWTREAAKMKEVYSDSILTLIAANSPSTRSGIFSPRQIGQKAVIEFRGPKRNSKMYLRSGNDLWDHSLQSSPLMGRGWVLQEGLLASRTLSYGHQQMIWECSQFQADEGGRTTKATEDYRAKGFLQQLIRRGERPKESFFERMGQRLMKQEKWWTSFSIASPYDKWYDICEQFTVRSLTKDFDVLPALAGIASVFQHVLDDTYYAGLWKKDIMSSMLWERSPRYPAKGDYSTRFDQTKKSEYLAPSWSWASIPGKTSTMSTISKTRFNLQHSAKATAKILTISTVLAGPDPFGKVVGGELILRGPYCKLEHMPPIYSMNDEWPNGQPEWRTTSKFQKHLYKIIQDVDTCVYERYQQHESCASQEYGVLEFIRWERSPGFGVLGIDLIILESTGKRHNEFRRIGYTRVSKFPVPVEADVSSSMYYGTIERNDAYDAAIGEKWGKRTIAIV